MGQVVGLGVVDSGVIRTRSIECVEVMGLTGMLEMGEQYLVTVGDEPLGLAVWGGIHVGEPDGDYNDLRFVSVAEMRESKGAGAPMRQIGTKYPAKEETPQPKKRGRKKKVDAPEA